MKAVNIVWDVEGEDDPQEVLASLPTEIDLPTGMTNEDEISDYISDKTGFCHKGFDLSDENPDERYPVGAVFSVAGDSRDMWIPDYSVRIFTTAEVLEQPYRKDKKVRVNLGCIDHDADVHTFIRKSCLKECNRIHRYSVMEIGTGKFLMETTEGFTIVEKENRTIFYDKNDAENVAEWANEELPGAFAWIAEV